jgi:hypothetical protein
VDAGADKAGPETARARAAVILGNDAVLAARPFSTAQLTRACGAAGFDIVVPPSWGDELVARACLEQLGGRTEQRVFVCSCDRVRGALPAGLPDESARVDIAAPPVAAARYLRLINGESLLVTYVGDCPSGTDPSIDARFSPMGFLASLHRQGIDLSAQPNEVAQTELDRWRRFESTPGGLPALRYLARPGIDRVVRESDSFEAGLAVPLPRSGVVIDLAEAVGCSCAADKATLAEIEPPRANAPIVVAPRGLDLSLHPSAARGRHTLRARLESDATTTTTTAPAEPTPAPPPARSAPSEPSAQAVVASPPVPAPRVQRVGASGMTPPRPVQRKEVQRVSPSGRRTAFMAVVPVLVVAAIAAVGVAVYRSASGAQATAPAIDSTASTAAASREADATPSTISAAGELDSSRVADSTRRATTDSTRVAPIAPAVTIAPDSARDSSAVADSATRALARRARARRAPQVVPGWMPQGQRTFTPIDTSAARRDSVRPRNPPGA